MLKVSVLPMLLLMTACATSFSTLNQALPLLQGQDIQMSMDYLGIPDQEYIIAGKKVYVWGTSRINPFNATSTSYGNDNRRLRCTIKMITENEIVQRIEYDGNNGACFKYSDRLKLLLDRSK